MQQVLRIFFSPFYMCLFLYMLRFARFAILGESVPVTKTSLPLYDAKEYTYHTLYSGTTIIQTKYGSTYVFLFLFQ